MSSEQYHKINEGLLKKGKDLQRELRSIRKTFKTLIRKERMVRKKVQSTGSSSSTSSSSETLHEQVIRYIDDANFIISELQGSIIANERQLEKLRKQYIKSIPREFIVS